MLRFTPLGSMITAMLFAASACATEPTAPEVTEAGVVDQSQAQADKTTEMPDANVRECRATEYTGSRMRKGKICMTRAQWAASDAANKKRQDLDGFFRGVREAASRDSGTAVQMGPSSGGFP
ncbi:MAG: hypothetical protein H6978_07225 [Gammaproteobacteria bacterium]|nr:hypothetical protein [Gammaproteobacteria bacterium]